MAGLFFMSKKRKNRQNDNTRAQNSSKGDRSRRVAKMNGHLLLARNEAAAAILRAARKEIEKNAVPEVAHVHTSMQAFRQFISFSGMFWKSLYQNIKAHTGSENRTGVSPARISERFSAAAKACGQTFVRWIVLLLSEIWTVLVLAIGTVIRSIAKFFGWCGFQIARFFRFVEERLYWKKLKYSIKNRIRKEERDKKNAARKAEREEQLAKKREEAEFRKAMKAEEEAFRKAKQKEEEAIRIAKQHREEAARMTAKIEGELAALSLRRKEEEEKVLQETKRKEEAMAALTEASREEEAERARLEERRRIEEEARIEAEKQEAEALKRLADMQAAEEERIRKAEADRLEKEKAASELKEAETKVSEAPAVSEPEQSEAEASKAEQEAEQKPEESRPVSEEDSKEEAVTEEPVSEPAEAGQAPEETAEEPKAEEPKAEETEPAEEPAVSEAKPESEKAEPVQEDKEPEKKAEKDSEPLRKKADEKEKAPKKGIAASAARTAVRTLPVHLPTITVPENLDARELITEARDNTNGVIYRVVKALEVPQAAAEINTALLAGAAKYSLIGLTAALFTALGTAGNEARPSAITFVILFFVIAIAGTALAAGLSWLSGLLVMKKINGNDNAVFLKQNSCYAPISALAYIFCAVILAFNKEKFIAVLVAVILLSIIGHLMVIFREKRVQKLYSALVYLLCIVIAAVAVALLAVIFSVPLRGIWNALH